jgi:hypothetical protein
MAQRETPPLPSPVATAEYLTDAWQRSILFLDVMRQRAAQYEALVREQFLMLVVDERAAIRAIPGLMPEPLEARRGAFAALRGVLEASGPLDEAPAERLRRVAALLGLGTELVTHRKAS